MNAGARPPAAGVRLAALAAMVATLAAPAARAEPAAAALDLEALMRRFAASRGVEAEFHEEKRLPLLAQPLASEGVLYFAPPDRMLRLTRSPESSLLLVAGDRLRIEDALGVEEIDLAAQPVARRFVDQLLLLFRGDLSGLRREYEVAFDAQGERWTLRLTSRSRQLRQLVREVTLRGEAGHLDEMVVAGADGDLTRTTYARVVSDRVFSPDELAALFPAQGSPSLPALAPAPR